MGLCEMGLTGQKSSAKRAAPSRPGAAYVQQAEQSAHANNTAVASPSEVVEIVDDEFPARESEDKRQRLGNGARKVQCPICMSEFWEGMSNVELNKHVDECLNRLALESC